MTLDQMASAIRNDIGNGLKESSNFAYSQDQLYDEISNVWNTIVYKMSLEGRSADLNQFSMMLDNVALEYGEFPYGGNSNSAVLQISIPRIAMTADNSAIIYLGPPDMSFMFKVYYSPAGVQNHRFSRVIKNRPYAFIDMANRSDGLQTVYFFNMETVPLQKISARAIFADPVGLIRNEGYFSDDEQFPAPLAIQQQIIETVTNRYIKNYRQLNGGYQANTQTDQK